MTFGQQLTSLRQERGLTLRKFASAVNYDASNISKVERGSISPPKGSLVLRKWGIALGLEDGTEEMNDFVALGLSANIKNQFKSDDEIAKLMPAFFRTVENRQLDPDTYKRLINILKQST